MQHAPVLQFGARHQLFGECGVVRHWGRIGASGQTRTDWYREAPEAETALQALLRVKRRRGYVS
ncbi:WGR domain-containing protein [Rubellimicrobium roseum]|uniref:WGR domain-containing protein n=1 Tax=Rubellimicrobium roseum TaxID=687525 RepID=UPI003CCC6809